MSKKPTVWGITEEEFKRWEKRQAFSDSLKKSREIEEKTMSEEKPKLNILKMRKWDIKKRIEDSNKPEILEKGQIRRIENSIAYLEEAKFELNCGDCTLNETIAFLKNFLEEGIKK